MLPPVTLSGSIRIRNRVRVFKFAEVLVAFCEQYEALEVLIIERLIETTRGSLKLRVLRKSVDGVGQAERAGASL